MPKQRTNPYDAPRTREATPFNWSLLRTFIATACFVTNLANHAVMVMDLTLPAWPPVVNLQMILVQGMCVLVTAITLLALYHLFEHKKEPRAFVLGGAFGGGLGIWLNGSIVQEIFGNIGYTASITAFFCGILLLCIDHLLSVRS